MTIKQFEAIHPFQDGNGRVGRLIMFKECLANGIVPFIIKNDLKIFTGYLPFGTRLLCPDYGLLQNLDAVAAQPDGQAIGVVILNPPH